MKDILKKGSLLCYALILITPMLMHINSSQQSDFENRKLSSWPGIPNDWLAWNDLPDQIDSYLNDRFGLREMTIKSANWVKYHLFNELLSKQVTPGKRGFVFFNSHSAARPDALLKSACGQNPINPDYRRRTIDGFKTLLDYFASKNTESAVAVVPIKARIYPEMLPEREQAWCQGDQWQWADELMHQLDQAGFHSYNPRQFMMALKQQLRVYLPTYFHWHGEAPKKIANDLMQETWQLGQDRYAVKPQEVWVSSDLRSHLAGLNLGDVSVKYDYSQVGVKVCDSGRCDPEADRFFAHRSLVYQYAAEQHLGRSLLIFSDSFGAYISAHFMQGFDQVTQIDISGINRDMIWAFYEYAFNKYKPTHSLYLIHEGGIWGSSVNNDHLLKQLASSNRQGNNGQ